MKSLACCFCMPLDGQENTDGVGNSLLQFTYKTLAVASNEFSKENFLGEGGFGQVHKGVMRNGQTIAVKNLKTGTTQGEKEFRTEVETISRIHHRHLVRLIGYCATGNRRLLVYLYAPNNALSYHLHRKTRERSLDWPTRLKIAIGAARGLAYLHEDCDPTIIHRDIKSSNILLDDNFEALVSDFGLAKLVPQLYAHVTTKVMGTCGYLAPEYAATGQITVRSDVYSFGVVLLELVTGKEPVAVSRSGSHESLVEWATPILAAIEVEEDMRLLADPYLYNCYDSQEMMRMALAAAACTRHSAEMRPRMGQVVRALEGEMPLSNLKPSESRQHRTPFSDSNWENQGNRADIRSLHTPVNPYSSSSDLSRMTSSDSGHTGASVNPYSSGDFSVPDTGQTFPYSPVDFSTIEFCNEQPHSRFNLPTKEIGQWR